MLIRNSIILKVTGGIRLPFKVCVLLSQILLLTSCITSLDDGIQINTKALEDTPYQLAYEKATNQYEVIHNFESKFVIHATQLTAEFRKAIAARHKRVFIDPSPVLSDSSAKLGFFISVYAASEDKEDLRDTNLWSVILKDTSGSKNPVLIKKLSDKERWKTYFPAVNLWTNEYLVIFDSPGSTSSPQQFVEPTKTTLVISNPDAKVHMIW